MEKYVFVGSRCFVYKKMIELGCEIVKTYVVKDTYLERYCRNEKRNYSVLVNRKKLVEELKDTDYDILVSNGCPYILPISELQDGTKKYINVHPSLLPDLRGGHPVNGALLFGRKHGVSCHYMTDDIDSGNIVSQLEIPVTEDVDLELLYLVTFISEGMAFEEAYKNDFRMIKENRLNDDCIYYTRKKDDFYLKPEDTVSGVINKIKAFSIKGQYARFVYEDNEFLVEEVIRIENPFIKKIYKGESNNKIIAVINDRKVLVKFDDELLELKLVDGVTGLNEQSIWLT